MAADPYRHFRIEAAELHAELGQGVLDLERGGQSVELVGRLLRLAHTLKGAARVVKQREIADHAHAIEDLLEPLRGSPAPAPRAAVDALLGLLDGIGGRVAALAAPVPAALPAVAPRAAADEPLRTVRAEVGEMDALLEGIGEAQAQVGGLRRTQLSVERARHLVDLLVEQLSNPRAVPIEKASSLAREIQTALVEVEIGTSKEVDQLDHELIQLRDAAEQLRLMPAGALFTSLERAVRDVAQAQGKAVVFEGRGGEVRLDAHVLGVVQGALFQLVRNAVAHGVESESDRRAAGKPREGRVTLEVARRGQRAVFTCRDDGRGVDVDAVRRAARRQGGAAAEGRKAATAPLIELLLRGGLSTSGTITEISGRGIGLDVLGAAAQRLGGTVGVETETGQGTAFELVVPLSIASTEVLLVEVSGATVAIPLDAVRRALHVASTDVATTAQGESVVHAGVVVPFAPLSRLLARRPGSAIATRSAVIVGGASGLAALGVDRLLGTATVIQRPLPELAPSTALVAGTSMDSSGHPRLVLDPDGLVAAARAASGAPPRQAPRSARILVVDDSLTTRMLEQSILESAGYEVEVASSAEEALDKVAIERFALILVDVEMPGMDGFSFIEHTRGDPSSRDVPCILVTSRASPEDRRRGQEVGARGYVDKGEFDQNVLLEQIRKLVA